LILLCFGIKYASYGYVIVNLLGIIRKK